MGKCQFSCNCNIYRKDQMISGAGTRKMGQKCLTEFYMQNDQAQKLQLDWTLLRTNIALQLSDTRCLRVTTTEESTEREIRRRVFPHEVRNSKSRNQGSNETLSAHLVIHNPIQTRAARMLGNWRVYCEKELKYPAWPAWLSKSQVKRQCGYSFQKDTLG